MKTFLINLTTSTQEIPRYTVGVVGVIAATLIPASLGYYFSFLYANLPCGMQHEGIVVGFVATILGLTAAILTFACRCFLSEKWPNQRFPHNVRQEPNKVELLEKEIEFLRGRSSDAEKVREQLRILKSQVEGGKSKRRVLLTGLIEFVRDDPRLIQYIRLNFLEDFV